MEVYLSDFLPKLKLLSGLNCTVYLNNWDAGFGSALACLVDNIIAFKKYNVNIIPQWNKITSGFKYTDGKINTFYEFFDDNYDNIDKSTITNIVINHNVPVIKGGTVTEVHNDLTIQQQTFKSRFKLKQKYIDLFEQLTSKKEFTFSVHLRSNFQKQVHYDNDIIKIEKVIKKLQDKYGKNATPFIATDVTEYLNIFLTYFPLAVYNADCFRIQNDKKDTPLSITSPGIRLAEDIILDLIGLSKGKTVYMSESNFYLMMRYIFDENLEIINIRSLN